MELIPHPNEMYQATNDTTKIINKLLLALIFLSRKPSLINKLLFLKRNADKTNVENMIIENSDVIGWKNTMKKQRTSMRMVISDFFLDEILL
jgi:hypothetical protein